MHFSSMSPWEITKYCRREVAIVTYCPSASISLYCELQTPIIAVSFKRLMSLISSFLNLVGSSRWPRGSVSFGSCCLIFHYPPQTIPTLTHQTHTHANTHINTHTQYCNIVSCYLQWYQNCVKWKMPRVIDFPYEVGLLKWNWESINLCNNLFIVIG